MLLLLEWVTDGKMDFEDAAQSYQSWRAHAKRCDSYDTLQAMDERFAKLFAAELAARKLKFPCTLKAEKTKTGWVYTRRSRGRKETIWNTSYTAGSGQKLPVAS